MAIASAVRCPLYFWASPVFRFCSTIVGNPLTSKRERLRDEEPSLTRRRHDHVLTRAHGEALGRLVVPPDDRRVVVADEPRVRDVDARIGHTLPLHDVIIKRQMLEELKEKRN